MRSKTLGALFITLAACIACAPPAGAVVANSTTGRVGYLPLNERAGTGGSALLRAAAPKGATVPTGAPPLIYHAHGPVMHSQESFAIFWEPSGHPFPTGYKEAIETYLQHVAADSGKTSNVYSVSAQYTDESGHASYGDTYGGSLVDTTPYPTTGTCAPYEGFTEVEYTACVSDAKLEAEVEADVSAESWPTGLGAEYYVVLPPEVGSCFEEGSEPVCFDAENEEEEGFCAYHSFAEPAAGVREIYANISYSPGDVFGCGVGEYPNGHGVDGNVDDTLSSLSHEANESITDPLLNAWFDEEGFENGDECRNSSDDFGAPLGGAAGALFNQSIAGAHYYLQQEWSNDIEDCAQRVVPAAPAIADPDQVFAGESASFDGSESVAGSGGIVPGSFEWDFGDGETATGPTPAHTYATPGTFTVTLTVEDDGGFTYSTTREVEVTSPPPPLPPEASTGSPSGLGDSGVTLNGGVNPKGRHTHYHFEFGTTTAYGSSTPSADAGTGLAEVPVAAVLNGLTPSTTYHYRLVATNAKGTTKTTDAVLTTAPAQSPAAPPPSNPPPPSSACKVPKLVGRTLGQAEAALRGAGCTLGRVIKPKAKKGHRLPPPVVKASAPRAGAEPAGGSVNLTLGPRPKPKKHRHR